MSDSNLSPEQKASGPPFTVDRYGSFGECIIAERDWLAFRNADLTNACRQKQECIDSLKIERQELVAELAEVVQAHKRDLERLSPPPQACPECPLGPGNPCNEQCETGVFAKPSPPPSDGQWIACADRLPPLRRNCVLASTDRMRAHDPDGCAKDVGHLEDYGSGRQFWSTQGESRSMTLNSFTHWMPISDPGEPSVEPLAAFVNSQQPMPADMARVLNDNLTSLYSRDAAEPEIALKFTDDELLSIANEYDQGPADTYEFSREYLLKMLREVSTQSLYEPRDDHPYATKDELFQAGANYAAKLRRMTVWLEANQPDVFRRGLWEAVDGFPGDKPHHEVTREEWLAIFDTKQLAPETSGGQS